MKKHLIVMLALAALPVAASADARVSNELENVVTTTTSTVTTSTSGAAQGLALLSIIGMQDVQWFAALAQGFNLAPCDKTCVVIHIPPIILR